MIGIDSDCIIDFLRNRKEIETTEINLFEVFYGVFRRNIKQEKEITEEFFNSLDILNSNGCGEMAASIFCELINNGNEIHQNDCLIAAILLLNGCDKIITRNVKDFSRIKNLEIITY